MMFRLVPKIFNSVYMVLLLCEENTVIYAKMIELKHIIASAEMRVNNTI